MAFKKGQSGNPGGRPKAVADLVALARSHAPDAFQRVVSLVNDPDPRVSLAAAQEVLSRAYGKPAQAMTGEGGEGPAELVVRWLTSKESE